LVPPVYIGAGAQIERDVELGPNAVIGANTVVDEGATVRNSSVLEGTYVGRLVKVDGRVVRGGLIVDAGSGESLRVVDPFLLGEVSPRLIVNLLSRVADCAGALFLLLLSLPVLVLIALALLLASLVAGSPGRVLELRPRVRWRRTTESDVPERQTYGVAYFHTRREDRALRRQVPLPLGSFLERTGLQRLPALFSVLTGQLRLVGVKPLDPSEADQLVEEWQRLPYETPPGFTGLWYVSVLHRQGPQQSTHSAQLADLEKLDEIVAADAYYTATRSLLEDLHLLLSTPVAWVRGLIGSGPNTADRGWTAWRPRRQRRSFSGSLASAAEVGKD
jgi:lipopolysaccharide/colanic/teichoic acid biosynthesis glycosyltransferase